MNTEAKLIEEIEKIQNKMRIESPINPFNNISELKSKFSLLQAQLKGFQAGKQETIEKLRCNSQYKVGLKAGKQSSISNYRIENHIRIVEKRIQKLKEQEDEK